MLISLEINDFFHNHYRRGNVEFKNDKLILINIHKRNINSKKGLQKEKHCSKKGFQKENQNSHYLGMNLEFF